MVDLENNLSKYINNLDKSISKEKTAGDTITISNEKTQSTVQNRIRDEIKISQATASKKIYEKDNHNLNSQNEKIEIRNQEDIFEKEIKVKGKISAQKKESFSNMDIFKKIIESEKNKRRESNTSRFFTNNPNDSYIHHSMMKVNHFGGVNNSTFIFDEKKENDVVLCVSNLNNQDFLENSLDSNFRREILNTNVKFLQTDRSKSELEISQNTQIVNNVSNNDGVKLLPQRNESFICKNKLKILIFSLVFIATVSLLINIFVYRIV